MLTLKHLFSAAVLGVSCFCLTGCSTPTVMRLSGTPGTTVTGHYRSGVSTLNVSGSVPLVVEVSGKPLQECEFRKSDRDTTLVLEIRQGRTQILECTAGPGTIGMKAQDDGGWRFQVLR